MSVKFSVIIPTYNRIEKLERCLNSLVLQDYKDFEVIICDDGSTDGTAGLVTKFESKLNLKYNFDKNWGGAARPRNIGIELAKGEYVCFLDSDDWWYPQKLEQVLPYLNEFDFIYHDLDKHNLKGKLKGVIKGRNLKGFKDLIINGNGIPNSSVVVKKELLNKVGLISEDIHLIAVEDTDYWIRIAMVSNRFKYLNMSLGAYWIEGNISISQKQIIREKYLLDKFHTYLSSHELLIAEKSLKLREARIFHKIGLFNNATTCYKQSYGLPAFSIKLKSLVGMLLCKFNIVA